MGQIDYLESRTLPEGNVRNYGIMLDLGLNESTLFEREHPPYNDDKEYGMILETWLNRRSGWWVEYRDKLPKPKRKVGRVKSEVVKSTTEKKKKKFDCHVQLGLPSSLVAAISTVQGDLTIDECIRQLLTYALGPLAKK